MQKKIIEFLKEIGMKVSMILNPYFESDLLALGALLSNQQYAMNSKNINDYEFKIFSQWGDDGIIQYLIKNIEIKNKTFIEFGVENYLESTTRFLLMHSNWSGYIMDGSQKAMTDLTKRRWYWKYSLNQKAVFITKENINQLLKESNFKDLGLLCIDIDGNDYHILKEIDFTELNPSILVLEYNSVFGRDRKISVPYKSDFVRNVAHYSNLYFGASLAALTHEASLKGYSLVGCTMSGNNAFFVRNDLLNDKIKSVSIENGYIESKFREGRNQDYSLSFLDGKDRLESIRGLDVLNVESNQIEKL